LVIIAQIQLGKQGITENFISTLKEHFKKKKIVKISVLKSCCRDKKELKGIEQTIKDFLGNTFTTKSIGYTITVRKWRKTKG